MATFDDVKQRLRWIISEVRRAGGEHALENALHELEERIDDLERHTPAREEPFEVRYNQAVNAIVEEIRRQVMESELLDPGVVMEEAEQAVDGHSMVIYTGQAQQILAVSRNDGAYWDHNGTPLDEMNWSVLAYYAMREDVMEAIHREGLDDPEQYREDHREEPEEEEEAAADEDVDPALLPPPFPGEDDED